MTPNPRQAQLLAEVRSRGSVSVQALADQYEVTLQIVRRAVKLLTNNLNVAAIPSDNPDCEVIVAGGIVRSRDYDYREVKVARAIIEHSREVWVGADHSKFNRPAMVEVARIDQIDTLFTDTVPPAPFAHLLMRAGVNCVTCA